MASAKRVAWEMDVAFRIFVQVVNRREAEWVERTGRSARIFYRRLEAYRTKYPDRWAVAVKANKQLERSFRKMQASEAKGHLPKKVWFGDRARRSTPVERGLLFALVAECGWAKGVRVWSELTTLNRPFAAKLKQYS